MKKRNYEDDLLDRLKDNDYAIDYLNAVLEDPSADLQVRFLIALRAVAKAHGFSKMAKDSSLNRESLYKLLSENGNPELKSLFSILHSLDLVIQIKYKKAS